MIDSDFCLSDLDNDELERIAGECDVAGADCAKRGNYDRADDLKLAGSIVRKYAEDREGAQESRNFPRHPLRAGPDARVPLWPRLIRERLGRLFTRSVAVDDSRRFRRPHA